MYLTLLDVEDNGYGKRPNNARMIIEVAINISDQIVLSSSSRPQPVYRAVDMLNPNTRATSESPCSLCFSRAVRRPSIREVHP